MSDSPTRAPSPPPPNNPHSPNFAQTELEQSLALLPSGALTSYQLRPASMNPPGEARVNLALLERGDEALVGVSTAGWKVHFRSFGSLQRMTAEATSRDWETFDSLENLVAYLSPAFDKTRVSSLMDQLHKIAIERREQPEAPAEDRMAMEEDGPGVLDGDED